jgi:type II secretory pathway pseudopilin PulG
MSGKNNRKQFRFNYKRYLNRSRFFENRGTVGFTMIELVVVLGVSVMLTAILVTLNRSGERNIVLFNEQARLVQALTSAKILSLQTFVRVEEAGNVKTCGYGVHFEDDSYTVFVDSPLPDPLNSSCIDENNQYTGNRRFDGPIEIATTNQDLEATPFLVYSLDPRIEFGSLPGNNASFDVLFVPPEPTTYFFPDGLESAIIPVKLKDESGAINVKITKFGQIST